MKEKTKQGVGKKEGKEKKRIKRKKGEKGEKVEENKTRSLWNDLVFLSIILFLVIILLLIFYLPKYFEARRLDYYYNGYHFKRTGPVWALTTHSIEYPIWYLHFDPKDMGDVVREGDLDGVSDEFKRARVVYVTFDPEKQNLSFTTVAAYELTIGLSRYFNKVILPACTTNTTECSNVTIIDCDTAELEGKPTVFLNLSDWPVTPSVSYNKYCIVTTGFEKDLVKAVDYFLLDYYGVFNQ